MEDLREEIEKELFRSKAQVKATKAKYPKSIAEGRIIAYQNVLAMIDKAEEERKSQPLPQDIKWDS